MTCFAVYISPGPCCLPGDAELSPTLLASPSSLYIVPSYAALYRAHLSQANYCARNMNFEGFDLTAVAMEYEATPIHNRRRRSGPSPLSVSSIFRYASRSLRHTDLVEGLHPFGRWWSCHRAVGGSDDGRVSSSIPWPPYPSIRSAYPTDELQIGDPC